MPSIINKIDVAFNDDLKSILNCRQPANTSNKINTIQSSQSYTPEYTEMMLLSGDPNQMEQASISVSEGSNLEGAIEIGNAVSSFLNEVGNVAADNVHDISQIRSLDDLGNYVEKCKATVQMKFTNIGEAGLKFLENIKDGIELASANTSATQLEMYGALDSNDRETALQGVADNVAVDYTGNAFNEYWNSDAGQKLNEQSYVKYDSAISGTTKGATTMGLYVVSSLNPVGWLASASAVAGESYEHQLNEGATMNDALVGATPMIALDFGLNMIGAKTIAEPIKNGLKSAGSIVSTNAKRIAGNFKFALTDQNLYLTPPMFSMLDKAGSIKSSKTSGKSAIEYSLEGPSGSPFKSTPDYIKSYRQGETAEIASPSEIKNIVFSNSVTTQKQKDSYREQLVKIQHNLSSIMPDLDVAQRLLDAKLATIVSESEVGRRTSVSTLEKCLDSGTIKNQFETDISGGILDGELRVDVENTMMGVPIDSAFADRPIYGMLFPSRDYHSISIQNNYILNGPGSVYGIGKEKCVIIFNKDAISDTTTICIGDSVCDGVTDGLGCVNVTTLNEPKFKGAYEGFEKKLQTEQSFREMDLGTITMGDENTYIEAQIHGASSHEMTPANIKEIIFISEPDVSLQHKLESVGISWRAINESSDLPKSTTVSKGAARESIEYTLY